ncbi:MAG: 50S ribosomal protein L6 [Acidobacteria bacterium]|nr:50S ribosomal protein L6 [Acidobacteriota bacterium]
MSRIGAKPISVPSGVSVTIESSGIRVKGPKGVLTSPVLPGIEVQVAGGVVQVTLQERAGNRAYWGLTRALLANAVTGVSQGFKKELDIVGVGYRAQVKGRSVSFALGYSHPVEFALPDGIDVQIEKNTHLVVSGPDKQVVGEVAARMRALRKPDPYKQKGVRYTGERLIKKAGKTGA